MHQIQDLPNPYQPFVIRDDFIVRADLFPLPGMYNGRRETLHFELDNHYERYLHEKLTALQRAPDKYRAIDPAQPYALAETYWRLFGILASEHPQSVRIEGASIRLELFGITLDLTDRLNIGIAIDAIAPLIGERVASWLHAQAGLNRLGDALALACQEDIVIMQIREDGTHHAESLHVLLPSTWNPREKYQQSFETIHEPVAESARLIASARNLMRAIVNKGPYVRFGLSLTTLSMLDSHPDHEKPWNPGWLDDPDVLASKCTVRIERQTTFPMPDLGRGLFTVRIYNTPLKTLATNRPDLIPRLATILRAASPAVVAYKGMGMYASAVADWCENQSSRG